MYDISGFGYDIRDVVRVLNLTIRRKNARSYDVDCPFCNHKTGKLNINIEKNVFRCNYCDAHGGMLDLYSKLYNVTKTEANQQIREALNLGQYRDDYQRTVRPERDLEPPAPVNSERASDMEIDQTYSQMLSLLTLSRKHQEDLQRRGLTPEQIAVQRYRSVPLFGVRRLVEKLADKKMFPGYVLIHMVMNDDTWYVVRNTRGVTGFVGPGSKPVPLSEEEMAGLGFARKDVVVEYQIGDTIVVTAGAWKDTIGAVKSINEGKKTLTINVEMFGRETPVELSFTEVKKM